MFFMLSADRQGRLEVASDNGHCFSFNVVPVGRTRRVKISDARWRLEQRPANTFPVLRKALRFASVCARDQGLA